MRYFNKKKRSRTRQSVTRKPRIESLEAKALLAADLMPMEVPDDIPGVSPVDPVPTDPPEGVVVIEGTENSDFVYATVFGDQLFILHNNQVDIHQSSEVDVIAVWAKGGNDFVIFDASVVDQNGLIMAGAGEDFVLGGSGHDYILGGGGADTLYGGLGNDLIDGDAGDDRIFGQFGNDAILGGLGDDTIDGGAGGDAMAGGSGNDHLIGGDGRDWMFGDATNEIPTNYQGLVHYAVTYTNVNTGNDSMEGGDGIDLMFGGNGNDRMDTGDHSVLTSAEVNTVNVANLAIGGMGDDTIVGGDGVDYIFGGWGADELIGGGGNDGILGDPTDVAITPTDPVVDFRVSITDLADADAIAREIDDVPLPAAEPNEVMAGIDPTVTPIPIRTNDTIRGGRGNDTILGMLGDDHIEGGVGNDRIGGGSGNDEIHGGDGNDTIVGQLGHDWLYGDAGNDHVAGSQGNDILFGGVGHDELFGGLGNDVLLGEEGDDYLEGGDDTDFMAGGPGADKIYALDGFLDFIFTDEDDEVEADPIDLIF